MPLTLYGIQLALNLSWYGPCAIARAGLTLSLHLT